jgi:hypothetical protein
MQYPSGYQPSTRLPSEAHTPELPQQYAPQYPSAMPDREIVIYSNRRQILIRTIMGVFIAFISSLMVIHGVNSLFQDDYIMSWISSLVFLIPGLILCVYVIGSMVRFFFIRTPLLIINCEGITVGKMPTRSGCFIPWCEIEAIYSDAYVSGYVYGHLNLNGYKYLCVRPKDTEQFLQRFNAFERFNRRHNAIVSKPAVAVPQVFMERPVDETLQCLVTYYSYELYTCHIQLHR